jgi:hypothetical protein
LRPWIQSYPSFPNRRGRDHPNFDYTAAGGSLGLLTGDLRIAPLGLRRCAIEVPKRGLSFYAPLTRVLESRDPIHRACLQQHTPSPRVQLAMTRTESDILDIGIGATSSCHIWTQRDDPAHTISSQTRLASKLEAPRVLWLIT